MFSGKNVLVAGGTGLIGIPLVDMLIGEGANVRIASLDPPERAHPDAEFLQADMTVMANCLEACGGMDYVFNLLGVKGSPLMAATKPASNFVPTLLFSISLMEAARRKRVAGYLYTSSIGVYAPAEVFREDDVWKTFPSENDKFPGWAKRMGELQAEAFKIQYGWDNVTIVRPANVYGPYDNFDAENAMVVPSLIRKAVSGQNPMEVWGDGSPIRDFVHARDVAKGMMLAAEKGRGGVFNLGSGTGVTIRRLVEAVVNSLENPPELVWDPAKPAGDPRKIMDISRARGIGYGPSIPLDEGVRETVAWYKANKDAPVNRRYDVYGGGREAASAV